MAKRNIFLVFALLASGCTAVPPAEQAFLLEGYLPAPSETVVNESVSRIAFGSCSHQNKPQPIWQSVLTSAPDLFVFVGDNVYADTDSADELAFAYRRLNKKPGVQQLRRTIPVVATWDDHDYGQNDIGREYIGKQASRRIMLDFWGASNDSRRRDQPGGIYTQYRFGEAGKRVQLLLLDARWNRTALASMTEAEWRAQRDPLDMGPYSPVTNADATLLGDDQWRWLEAALQEPAEIRIIATPIQALAEFTGWESWANFPKDRARLLSLISQSSGNTVFISGDTHWSELSRVELGDDRSLWEITSSGLTEEWKAVSPNTHRIGDAYASANFGLLTIDWTTQPAGITMTIHDVDGEAVLSTVDSDRHIPAGPK